MGHNILVISVGGGADQTLKRLKQTNIQNIDYLTINSYSAAFPDINLGSSVKCVDACRVERIALT